MPSWFSIESVLIRISCRARMSILFRVIKCITFWRPDKWFRPPSKLRVAIFTFRNGAFVCFCGICLCFSILGRGKKAFWSCLIFNQHLANKHHPAPAWLSRIQSLWTTPNSSIKTCHSHAVAVLQQERWAKPGRLVEHQFANVGWNIYLRSIAQVGWIIHQ